MKSVVTAVLALVAAVLLGSPAEVTAQVPDARTVVDTWITVQNAHDLDGALALFTDDGVIRIVPAPPGTSGVWSGKQQLREVLQSWFADNLRIETTNVQVTEDRVTWFTRVWFDSWITLGVAPIDNNSEAIVQGGKLKSFTANITPEGAAKLQAAAAAAQPAPATAAAPRPAPTPPAHAVASVPESVGPPPTPPALAVPAPAPAVAAPVAAPPAQVPGRLPRTGLAGDGLALVALALGGLLFSLGLWSRRRSRVG